MLNPGLRVVCVREVQRALKESVKRLLEDKIEAFGVGSHFQILSDSIKTPGGGTILFQGMQDHTAESIKSLEGFDVAYIEEAQTITKRSLEMLRPTIRKAGSEIWCSWNPRHSTDAIDDFLRGVSPPENAIVVNANYSDNPFLPKESDDERAYDEVHNPQRYGHIWLGEYEPQAIGAIWSPDVIHRNRVEVEPELTRILIAIDPAISSNAGSDKTGIVAVGIGTDGRGYVLAVESMVGTPQEWGERAVALYSHLEADAIVAEVNQGGEMVTNTIHTIRPDIKVIPVRATRGKHVRAEPISALYGLNRISHVGHFPNLERQMCLFTAEGYEGEGSPDDVDAMVWGFTELFNKMIKKPRDKAAQPPRASNKYRPLRWKK